MLTEDTAKNCTVEVPKYEAPAKKLMKRLLCMSTAMSPTVGAMLICFLQLGCAPEEPKVSISYLAVNHTSRSVTEISINGEGGILNASAYGGGGKQICCVTLPAVWRPGLTVTIGWQGPGSWLKDESGREVIRNGNTVLVEDPVKTRTVEVPKYEARDLQHFDIHFLPNDEVKVMASWNFPEHRDYPIPYPETPAKK